MAVAKRRIGEGGDVQEAEYSDHTGSGLDTAKGKRLRTMFLDAARATEDWATKAEQAYRYVSGDQWSDADRAHLLKNNRPCLTINLILGAILFLEGLFRQQRTEPTLLPVEPGDRRAAEAMGAIYKWIGVQSREPVIDDVAFRHKIVAGISWQKVVVDFDDDPMGQPKWEAPAPLTVYPDPNFFAEGDYSVMEYCCHAIWLTQEEAVERWPEFKDDIMRRFGEWLNSFGASASSYGQANAAGRGDAMRDERMFWDKEQKRVRLVEIWYTKRVPTTVALIKETGEVISDEPLVKRLKRYVEITPAGADEVVFIRRNVKRICLAHILDDILLSDEASPFDQQQIPLFPDIAYLYWKQPFSPVHVMMDPQADYNKKRSAMVELVAKMPLSGFFNDEANGAKTKDLENFAHGNGVVINYKGTPPVPIPPPQLPQALTMLATTASTEIRQVVNIHNELLGSGAQRTVSGRAIEARQRGGLTVQEPLLETTRQNKQLSAKFMVRAIQQFVSAEKAARILGASAMREEDPASPSVAMAQLPTMELQEILERAMLADFDLIIDNSREWSPSIRARQMEVLSDMFEKYPEKVPIDVIANAMVDNGLIDEQDRNRILEWNAQGMAGLPPTIPGYEDIKPPMQPPPAAGGMQQSLTPR